MAYEIEFFRRSDGTEPVRRFLDSLSDDKRNALVAALTFVLARTGLDVCRSEWGKQLGGGLAEFRLRHDEREVLSGHGASNASELPEKSPEKILLRVFFHAHGNRLILLLSGYDKGSRSSTRHQQQRDRARTRVPQGVAGRADTPPPRQRTPIPPSSWTWLTRHVIYAILSTWAPA